jgi:DNA-binding winged helix-turn-helix (wHTH) protein
MCKEKQPLDGDAFFRHSRATSPAHPTYMTPLLKEPTVACVAFGPFRLFPSARVLYKRDIPVELGSRALDILIALVDRAGEVVNQRELIARAWRGLVVESGNLRVQMTYLRRCLGDGEEGARYIANVPGQGYSFVAPVSRPDSSLWSDAHLVMCFEIGMPEAAAGTIASPIFDAPAEHRQRG